MVTFHLLAQSQPSVKVTTTHLDGEIFLEVKEAEKEAVQ